MSIATPESRRALPSCGGRMNAYILTRKSRHALRERKGHNAQDSPFIASMANADALTITPETSAGTALTSTIRNSGENVKKYYADLSAKACVK